MNFVPFQDGEKVWLRNWCTAPEVSNKLQPYWRGPYVIKRKISDVSYLVRFDKAKPFVVHHDHLFRCSEREGLREREEQQTEEIEQGLNDQGPAEQPAVSDAQGISGDSLRVAEMVPSASEILPTGSLSADAGLSGLTSQQYSRNDIAAIPATSLRSSDELLATQTEAEPRGPSRQPCAPERARERRPPTWLNDYVTDFN